VTEVTTCAPAALDALGDLWDALLRLRDDVKCRGANSEGFFETPLGGYRLVVITTGAPAPRRAECDTVFSATHALGVDIVAPGVLSDDQLALAATYLAPCLAPLWAAAATRAITFGHVAQTIDGKIATSGGDSKWIGGIGNQTHAHRMRALCDAVLIGSRTLNTDEPKLNVRHVRGPDPIRVVVGSDVDVRALRNSAPAPVLVVGSAAAGLSEVDILDVQRQCTGRFEMRAVLEALYLRGITSVYVEGGAQTLERFLEEGMLDALQIHIAPIIVGDGRAAFPRPSVERLVDAQRLHGARFVRVDDGIMLVARCSDGSLDGKPSRAIRAAQGFWHDGAGQSALRATPLRRPPADWCEIETHFSAVSPGTERLVASGGVPNELHAAMRCAYMEGQFPYPVKYGYSLVGRVVDGPDDVVGRAVHVFHPHQDRATVRVADLHAVPDSVPMSRATLAPNLETALNAVWDADVTIGHRVLVVGFGIVGSLIARLLSRISGVEVDVLDVDPAKRGLAARLGFNAMDVAAAPDSYDVAFHASATGPGLQSAVDAVGFEGRVIDVSWYGAKNVSLALGGSFHHQRKRIESSQVGSVATRMRPRWTHARRMDLVMRLLTDPTYDEHITRTVDFTALSALFAEAPLGLAPSLSILVRY
jgi:riboflavin-specific deaminase-like protein